MKTPVDKRFRTLPVIMFVISVVFGPIRASAETLAQTTNQTMTIDGIVQTYDVLESELLRRFKSQVENRDPELIRTVRAFAHIRSKKAIPLLLNNIEVDPRSQGHTVGEFSIRIVGAHTYKDHYVMLDALIKIGGISLEQCIAEVEKADDGSLRETLLAHLGQGLHGKAFMQEIRSRASSPKGKEKWERLLAILPQD